MSCVVSLNYKTKICGKIVLGRSSIGTGENFGNQGHQHWNKMKQNLGTEVEKWHDLN